MSGRRYPAPMIAGSLALAASASAQAPRPFDPVAFFTGATQGRGELRELLGKPKRTSTQSVGRVDKDGSLVLDQKVAVEGDPLRQRRWRLKQVAPGKFSGTLSDAKGPVEAEVRGQTVRIRYVMKGNIKVEQELTAQPGGRAVINRGTFRKFGMKVAIMKERIDKR
ncbi:MAG TPA: DUF3833 family protein [Sphingomicrobium sp.]|jgi:hypothetical protein|nr:DUF3833 family protein [Sphingomicrobium sp.]